MKFIRRKQFWFLVRAASVLALGVAVTRQAGAVNVSFTIDPTLSSYHIVNVQTDGPLPPSPLQLSTILGANAVPQTAGADTDALSGTINADLTGGVLTFSGGSSIILAANPNGPFQPVPAGSITDNFGIQAVVPALGNLLVKANIYNSVGDIVSGTATNGQAPTVGALTLATTAGFTVNSITLTPTPLSTTPGADIATAPVLLYEGSGIQTLVLPVVRITSTTTALGVSTVVTEGQIVATRAVPEPGTFALLGMAGLGLGFVFYRRKQG